MAQRYIVPLVLCLTLLATVSVACGSSASTTAKTAGRSPTAIARSNQQASGTLSLNSPLVYVALGASDAVGIGASEPDVQGYVPRIAAHLAKGSRLVNLGESGVLLHDALSEELPQAMAAKPQLVTIWLVANDLVAQVSYDDYMSDLNTLLQRLRSSTKADLVMANLPDVTLLPALAKLTQDEKTQLYAEVQRWNGQIAVLAQKYHVTLVDLFAQKDQLTAHPEYISADGFHPNATGYAKLADLFWEAILAVSSNGSKGKTSYVSLHSKEREALAPGGAFLNA